MFNSKTINLEIQKIQNERENISKLTYNTFRLKNLFHAGPPFICVWIIKTINFHKSYGHIR